MNNFRMDSIKEKYISDSFEIKPETINELYQKYTELNSLNQKQYLAHIMRSLEEYIRSTQNAPFFRITCKPSSNNSEINISLLDCTTSSSACSFSILAIF